MIKIIAIGLVLQFLKALKFVLESLRQHCCRFISLISTSGLHAKAIAMTIRYLLPTRGGEDIVSIHSLAQSTQAQAILQHVYRLL